MSENHFTPQSAALRELIAGLESGLEAFSHYPRESAEYRQAYARLGRAFASVWESRPSLTIDVRAEGLSCDDVAVQVPGEDYVSLARTLWDEGIRTLTFTAGSEGAETLRFLSAVQRTQSLPDDDVDDLRTFLWDLDLEHIQYTIDEPDLEVVPTTLDQQPSPAREESETVRAQVVEEAATARRREGIVDVDDFDSTLYFLDKRELEYLKDGIQAEYAQNLAVNVSALLLDVLELQTDTAVRAEVIGKMERFLPHLLGQGNFAAAAYLLSQVDAVVPRASDLIPEQRKALLNLADSLSEPGALRQLFHYLEDVEDTPTVESLSALLVQLRPGALSTIFRWVGGLNNPGAVTVVNEAIERMAREMPRALAMALGSDDRTVALRALNLVQRQKDKDRANEVCALGSHPDGAVRVTVAETLAILGGSAAACQLTEMIDDPDGQVRIAALKALESRGNRATVDRLEEIIGDKNIQDRDLTEQRALFETYGSIAGPHGVGVLESILHAGWGGRRPSSLRACAAVALGAVGTPAARVALQKAERDKDPVVRNAASSALRRG